MTAAPVANRTARVRARFRDETGSTLLIAVGLLAVLTIVGTSLIQYSVANAGHAHRDRAAVQARSVAEAGINVAMAVLSADGNNPLDPSLLPSSEAAATPIAYGSDEGRTWGVLAGNVWTLHGVAYVHNPSASAPIRYELVATTTVETVTTEVPNAPAWNYLYAKDSGSECDLRIKDTATVYSSLYVVGNLCLENTARIVAAPAPDATSVIVKGNVSLKAPQNAVGAVDFPIHDIHVGGWCRYRSYAPTAAPCSSADNVWSRSYHGPSTPTIAPPEADFDSRYADAKPGPARFCDGGSGLAASTFENESGAAATRNSSANEFELTPGSDYTCEVWEAGTLVGRLNWDAAGNVLTVAGVVYFDGSLRISNGELNTYAGSGSIYLSGKFTMQDQTKLCAVAVAGGCDVSGWDPNQRMLIVYADGPGESIVLQNQAQFQGGLYGTNTVKLQDKVEVDGPLVGGTFLLENAVRTHEFPWITSLPVGTPGTPVVTVKPTPPAWHG